MTDVLTHDGSSENTCNVVTVLINVCAHRFKMQLTHLYTSVVNFFTFTCKTFTAILRNFCKIFFKIGECHLNSSPCKMIAHYIIIVL